MGGLDSPEISDTSGTDIPHDGLKRIEEHDAREYGNISTSSLIDPRKELYDSTGIDPVLARKMTLVNDAIDEIGMTPFQWKLFFLNGFGYAVDSVSSNCLFLGAELY